MSIPEYHSAIYKINTNKKIATRISFKHHNCSLLPKRMDFTELAIILSKMQEICFHDKNIDNENTDRIVDLFLEKREKTFMVAISLGYLPGVTNYMDFIDGGAATVQKSDLDFLDHPQPWINEVCRAKFSQMPPGESPVTIVMEMIEKYIKEYLMKNSTNINGLYLYVEKTPEHGNPDFLLKYYEKYGFRQMAHEDDEYFYMCKKIRNTHTKTLTKTRVVKFGGRKSRRK
jgi:hypothetical protein